MDNAVYELSKTNLHLLAPDSFIRHSTMTDISQIISVETIELGFVKVVAKCSGYESTYIFCEQTCSGWLVSQMFTGLKRASTNFKDNRHRLDFSGSQPDLLYYDPISRKVLKIRDRVLDRTLNKWGQAKKEQRRTFVSVNHRTHEEAAIGLDFSLSRLIPIRDYYLTDNANVVSWTWPTMLIINEAGEKVQVEQEQVIFKQKG